MSAVAHFFVVVGGSEIHERTAHFFIDIYTFAKSMKRRKVNSPISQYASIEELTPEILNDVIERIEIGHVRKNSKPGKVIQIYWKLK